MALSVIATDAPRPPCRRHFRQYKRSSQLHQCFQPYFDLDSGSWVFMTRFD